MLSHMVTRSLMYWELFVAGVTEELNLSFILCKLLKLKFQVAKWLQNWTELLLQSCLPLEQNFPYLIWYI